MVAVSGGADSIALLHFLVRCELLNQDDIAKNLLVAHFDHDLRADSAADARFVQQAAGELGLQCVEEVWQKPLESGNLAAAARTARYDFLVRVADGFGANYLATGHHQSDQAETFIERLLRGSGITGLGAMVVTRRLNQRLQLVRPLLNMSRATIESWLREQNIFWREDPSNQNIDYRRAYIRHKIVPALTALEPLAQEKIAAAAQRLQQGDTALEWALDQHWYRLEPIITVDGLSIKREPLLLLPAELLARTLRRCQHTVTEAVYPPSEKAVAGFIKLVKMPQKHGEMRIRGVKINKEDKRLIFCRSTQASH